MRKTGRYDEIKNAYKSLGGEATFYDGMINCFTLPGKAVCKLVWNMDKRKNDYYLELVLSVIPNNFSGKMLEVPVGTGILSMPVYETIPCAGRAAHRTSSGSTRLPPAAHTVTVDIRSGRKCR